MIPGVPYDEELEYIESTGTQYIVTNLSSTGVGLRACVLCEKTTAATSEMAMVGRGSGGGFELYFSSGKCGIWNTSGKYVVIDANVVSGRRYLVDGSISQTGASLTINGTTGSSSFAPSISDPTSVNLFRHNNGYYFVGRIYYCKLWLNDTLVGDFFPVRVNGVAKMYDRVTGKFPAHYGTFVAGPVVARPVMGLHFYPRVYTARDYIQDGLIAMWDGVANAGWGVHDASATTWKDLSGNNNDLVLQNGAHFDALSLISADRGKISAKLSPDAFLSYDTIEACGFWDAQRNASELICFGNSINNARMLTATADRIQVYSGTYDYPIPSELASARNTWSATYQEGAASKPYVAGVLVQTTPRTNNWNYSNHPFGLSGSSSYENFNFVGNYYCVRLYSRALTAAEIAHNYKIDKWRFNLT